MCGYPAAGCLFMDAQQDLKKIVPDGVLSGKEELIPYTRDASHFQGDFPLMVVLPRTTQQVSGVLRYCNENNIAVVARGGGTSLTGASVPIGKCIVMSLLRMDGINSISVGDGCAEVGAGARIDSINLKLSKLGYLFPPDPGSSLAATVGGIISTNAGGLRCVRYGTTKDWILGMEVVLMDGTVLQLGNRTLKSRIGYDLTSLMVGSEGTLAVVTKAFIKIVPKPEKVGRLLAYFDDIASLGKAVASIKGSGIDPLIAEYLDRMTMDAVEKSGAFTFGVKAPYLLLLDVDGPEESLERYISQAAEILTREGALQVVSTTDDAEMERLYTARKGAYSSLLRMRKSEKDLVVIGDIVVPPSSLPEVLREIEDLVRQWNIRVALFGHIGDGNIHANIMVDMEDNDESKRVDRFQSLLAQTALSHGGSVSAEHGIGIEKRELLRMEYESRHSGRALDLMKSMKSIFDPKGLLNPGKVFD